MGIQTFLEERRREKAREKALAEAERLRALGLVSVPTTTGGVEVPIGSPLAPVTFTRGGGGGISSADIRISAGLSEQQRQAELRRILEERRRQERERQRKLAEEKRAKTAAQLVAERARRIRELRREAGTLGKNLGFATEFSILQKFKPKKKEDEIKITRKDLKPKKVITPKFKFPTRVTRVDGEPKIDIGVGISPLAIEAFSKDTKFIKRNLIRNIEKKASKLSDKVKKIFNVPEANFKGELLDLSRITESITPKEKEVQFVVEKPKVPGGTEIKRRVNINDVDTGVLPPKQEFDMAVNDVFLNLSLGGITNSAAQRKLNDAEKNFIKRETSRVLPTQVLTTAGLAAIGTAVAPIGVALKILATTEALRKQKQIRRFALNNPKAAAKIFAANTVAALVGGGVTKAIQLERVKLPSPEIKFKGTGKISLTKKQIRTFDPKLEKLLKGKKITNTREFEIKIPNPKGKDVRIRIIEFQKNGKANFVGQELINGRVVKRIRGTSLASDSKILTRVVSNSIKRQFKSLEKLRKIKGLKRFRKTRDAEIFEFLEKFKSKVTSKSQLSRAILTKSETKLAKKFNLKKISSDDFRQLLRSFLKIKGKRKNQPFTKAEFKAASKLSKSQVLSRQKVIALKGVRQAGKVLKIGKKRVVQKVIRGIAFKRKLKGKPGRIKFRKIVVKPKIRRDRVQVTKARIKSEKIVIRTEEEGIGLLKQIRKLPKKKIQFIEIRGKRLKVPKAGKGRFKLIKNIKQRVEGRKAISNLQKVITKTQRTTGKNILQKPQTSPAGAFKQLGKISQKAILRQYKKFGIIKASAKSLTLVPLNAQQKKRLNAQRTKLADKLKKELKKKNVAQAISTKALNKLSILGVAQLVKVAAKLKKVKQFPPTKRPTISKPPFFIRAPPTKIPPIPFPKAKKKRAIRIKQKPVQVFNVFGKSRKRFVKLNVKPLTKDDALSRGTFAIDNTTSRQFKIEPAGKLKKPGILKKSERNYFKRQGFKLREFKIRKGRKFAIKPKYIEKTKFGIDTRGEKKGLTIARLLRRQRKKRKITPAQRKILLKSLKQARRIKKQKIKKSKTFKRKRKK